MKILTRKAVVDCMFPLWKEGGNGGIGKIKKESLELVFKFKKKYCPKILSSKTVIVSDICFAALPPGTRGGGGLKSHL